MGHSSSGYGVPSFRVWCSSACMFFPINSAGSSYPSIRAAEGFEKRQVPFESQPQIASVAESRINRMRSSLFCRASSAHVRIVLFSESDTPLETAYRRARKEAIEDLTELAPALRSTSCTGEELSDATLRQRPRYLLPCSVWTPASPLRPRRLGSDITGGLPGAENALSDSARPAIENQLQIRRMISRTLLRSVWIQPHQRSCREDSRSHPTRRRAGCILCRIA